MQELPANAESFWSCGEMLTALRMARFSGLQAPLGWAADVRSAGLRFATCGRANTPAEVAAFAREASGAHFVTLHLGWGLESDDEMDALARAVLDAQEACGIPILPETHRATMLQDIWRTLRLLERFPSLRLNLDASHIYCAGEFPYRGFEANLDLVHPILARAGCFHGRVSNGQIMQAPLTDPCYAENVRHFAVLWNESMSAWKAQAQPGDTLTFIPELGPPSSGYALTVPDVAMPNGRRELSDRWAEMQALGRLARALFAGQEPIAAVEECLPPHVG